MINESEDPYYEDEYEQREPDCYSCSCCGHTQLTPGMGNGCDKCGMFNVMQEEYF